MLEDHEARFGIACHLNSHSNWTLRAVTSEVIRKNPMRSFLLALFLLGSSLAHAQVVYFDRQIAQFEVPKGYRYGFEDGRRTLSLSPEAPHHIEIRLTFNSMGEYVSQRPMIGKGFVRDAATKKGKELFEVPGNGGVGFVDYSESRQAGQDLIRSTHGIMGLRDGYVTFSVTTEEKYFDSSAMKEIFARGLKELLGKVKSRGV